MGAMDARQVRRGGDHLAARPRRCAPGRRLGTDPRDHGAVDQPGQHGGPGRGPSPDRRCGAAGGRLRRSLQRGGRHRATGPRDRGPGKDGRSVARDRAGRRDLRRAGSALGIGRRAGRARRPQA